MNNHLQVLQDVADDFVENLVSYACQLSHHRGSNVLEARDVQMALEKHWDIRLPGVDESVSELKLVRKRVPTHSDAYRQRVASVRKSQSR